MNRLLFSILLLIAACSGGDSKGNTAPPSNEAVSAGPTDSGEPNMAEPTDSGAATPAPRSGSVQMLPAEWSKKEIKSYMKTVSKGLGVQCDHCHNMDDFASDKIPAKLAARKMIEMTLMLDKDNFAGQGRVTCMTCHRGALEP